MKRVLLVVDLQPEFKDKDGVYDEILKWVKTQIKDKKYDIVIGTACINSKDSAYVKYGCWYDCIDKIEDLEYSPDILIYKKGYGLDTYDVLDKDWNIDIIGYNTDCCVLKIAFDLFDRCYNFRVLSDYCYSSNGLNDHLRGCGVLRDCLGTAYIKGKYDTVN